MSKHYAILLLQEWQASVRFLRQHQQSPLNEKSGQLLLECFNRVNLPAQDSLFLLFPIQEVSFCLVLSKQVKNNYQILKPEQIDLNVEVKDWNLLLLQGQRKKNLCREFLTLNSLLSAKVTLVLKFHSDSPLLITQSHSFHYFKKTYKAWTSPDFVRIKVWFHPQAIYWTESCVPCFT